MHQEYKSRKDGPRPVTSLMDRGLAQCPQRRSPQQPFGRSLPCGCRWTAGCTPALGALGHALGRQLVYLHNIAHFFPHLKRVPNESVLWNGRASHHLHSSFLYYRACTSTVCAASDPACCQHTWQSSRWWSKCHSRGEPGWSSRLLAST